MTKKEKKRLHEPWKKTLIIKLLGRIIGFNLLLRKIKEMWRLKAAIDLIALDNRFFMEKFTSSEDYEHAKFGGPWLVFNTISL